MIPLHASEPLSCEVKREISTSEASPAIDELLVVSSLSAGDGWEVVAASSLSHSISRCRTRISICIWKQKEKILRLWITPLALERIKEMNLGSFTEQMEFRVCVDNLASVVCLPICPTMCLTILYVLSAQLSSIFHQHMASIRTQWASQRRGSEPPLSWLAHQPCCH